jgi:BirA family biotin operon repressor/biotin-[acetyl-CoA-carboxylase] ligase
LEASAALGLAAAVGLAEQLEALGVAVSLKWPNDLLVDGRKLAGLLPRLRLRGDRVRWAQVGLGLNGTNRPPQGGISVAQALAGGGFHPRAKPKRLLPLALAALERSQQLADDPDQVRRAAEGLLLRPPEGFLHGGDRWQVLGLERDGGLRLQRPGAEITLQRSF